LNFDFELLEPQMVAISNPLSFEYTTARIGDLRVLDHKEETGRTVVDSILVNDEPMKPTNRFWTSLYARFGFNKSFFRFFGHEEVFNRIADVESNKSLRLCVERGGENDGRLLAVSNPTKPVVQYDDLMEKLEQYDSQDVSYVDGIVQSTHAPRVGGRNFDVAGDQFSNRFVMETPVDGYGQPNIYLSLLREICSNGMVGYARAFRSSLSLGTGDDNPGFAISRALDGFGASADEGYAALRQRFQAAAKSWASVYEANTFHKKLLGLIVRNQFNDGSRFNDNSNLEHPVIAKFNEMTGDVSQLYGIANVDALSSKRQRSLPVKCTVYDLLNFTSELATHHLGNAGARTIQAAIGTLISSEYDIENSINTFGSFSEFFVSRRINGEIAMDLQSTN